MHPHSIPSSADSSATLPFHLPSPITMSFAAAIVSRISSLSPAFHSSALDSGDENASIHSSQGTCSSSFSSSNMSYAKSLESSPSISSSPDATLLASHTLRTNEHLAVLLPKRLWKPDSHASRCDTFMCRKKFTILERKHHCRKCGGVFCQDCSSRATTLLDVSNLEFLHPPRNVPITDFDSPTSPVVLARVCDDCYDHIHGRKSSHSPTIERSVSVQLPQDSDSSQSSSPSGSPKIPSASNRPTVRRAYTSPRIPNSPLRNTPPSAISGSRVSDADLGELATYPLRHSSAICKATGAGRWEPKPVVMVGYRPYGTKLPHEIELEREEEERRIARENPVLRDGDFQLRVPREPLPRSLGGPIVLSTF